MKRVIISLLLFGSVLCGLAQQPNFTHSSIGKSSLKANFISLTGESLLKGNPIDADGKIHEVKTPELHLIRSKSKSVQGTMLLLPGGAYEWISAINEGEKIAQFLNDEGYDVAILEYPVSDDGQMRNATLINAEQAFRLLKLKRKTFGLNDERLGIMGISAGGHLAARLVQKLGEKEQPDNLILTSPIDLNETLSGTVFPAIMPPVHPKARLFVAFSANDKKEWVNSCQEYTKTWVGYDGTASFNLLNDSVFIAENNLNPIDSKQLAGLLRNFLELKPELPIDKPNPAAVPVEGRWWKDRHAEKLELVAKNKYDLIFIGNSITHAFEEHPEYFDVWNQFFAPRKALNLGYSGYRTENILWNIQNGELEGQSPKVVVLEIGTNNVDEKNYPIRHTAGQLAGGIEAIVELLRAKLPETKIIVLRCFPGCYGGPNPTSHRAILERASDIVSKIADRKHIFYCDVNHVFLNMDGSINHEMMGDWLHPTPAGAKVWAQAMEPLLSQLMGDKSRDTDIPANMAIVPVSWLEYNGYDWFGRHAEILQKKDSINPQIVLIGNSITHLWGEKPEWKNDDRTFQKPRGQKAWTSVFSNYRVLNLGFGWDRTQNVLWRLDHGEIDALHPKLVIINIGTNNTSQTPNTRINTAPEIVDGIRAICMRVRSKVPYARIILMAVFPREQNPEHPRRILINEINKQLAVYAKENEIDFVDIGPKMLALDGTLPMDIAADFCHPTDKGYQIWADEIRPFINEP